MKDQNIYRKLDNGRYQAYGVCYQPDHLQDGIWYVRHYPGRRSETSVPYIAGLFRVGDAAEIDVPVLCGMEEICTRIMDNEEFRKTIKNPYCLNDIVHMCVKLMIDMGKEQKKEKSNENSSI